jgi:hypothetical protein
MTKNSVRKSCPVFMFCVYARHVSVYVCVSCVWSEGAFVNLIYLFCIIMKNQDREVLVY